MRRSIILDSGMMERLTNEPEYEHVIVGTGELARDMQKKLALLGLKVACFIGVKTDRENGILSYSDLTELGDPKKHRFIMCCDTSELTLQTAAQSLIYKFVGRADENHAQMLLLSLHELRKEPADCLIDSITGNTYMVNNQSFVSFGPREDNEAFHIHILGGCYGNSLLRHANRPFAEQLQDILEKCDFFSVVYDWQNSNQSTSDNISRFIRDVCFHKIDLLIHHNYLSDLDPLVFATSNVLSTRSGSITSKPPFINHIDSSEIEASNGIHHDTDLFAIKAIQQRTLGALAKRHGFAFWDVLAASNHTISVEQGMTLRGYTPGYMARRKKVKDRLLSALDSRYAKDHTDIFSHVDDIFSVFADYSHYNDEGCRLVAARLAADILNEFSIIKRKDLTNG